MYRIIAAGIAAVVINAHRAAGIDTPLSLDGALALARQQAPALVAARARVDEARGQLLGASVWLRDNPVIGAAAGRRLSAQQDFTEVEVEASQHLGVWGQRQARIDAAEARVASVTAGSSDANRRLLRDVAAAFLRALAAQELLQLARDTDQVAAELQRTAQRRHDTGEVAILDVNLARVTAARAAADIDAAQASLSAWLGELRILLGLRADEALTLRGPLLDRHHYELATIVASATNRPDLQALAAEIRGAEAEARLGKTMALPELGVGVSYARDQGDNIVLGGVTVSVPVFSRGQDVRAISAAQERRLRGEADATRRAVDVEVRAALDAYQHQTHAVETFERLAVPSLDENEGLARRSYEAGQMTLAEFLLVRRETLDARRAYVDHQLAAALSRVELEARAGILQ